MLSAQPLYIGRWYGYGSIKADKLFPPDSATTLQALANLSDGSYFLELSEDFSLPHSVPITISLYYYGGGAQKELTLQPGDRSFSLTIQTLIVF
jgi:hypothetical protein